MKIKRYFAPNMRQAMLLVKEEHGDDAVILSSRTTDEGVELVAACDPEAQDYQQQKAAPEKLGSSYLSPETPSSMKKEQQEPVAASPELNSMAQELKAVRAMLENQLSGLAWGQNEQVNPEKVGLIKRLMRMGIGWSLSQKLVENIVMQSEQAWSEILMEMEQGIPIEERDVLERGGIVALVGPTGVGKTTTIAKMASRFVMRNSPNQLALITTDCYKIGAQAQLKTFADLIGVPVHVVNAQGELYALLASLSDKKLILIDTAGMSQRDLQLSQQLTSGHDGISTVRNYLVMSAATQLNVMKDIVKSFNQVGLQGCILTKVDEAVQLGNILTVLIEERLSIAYMSDGQRVPEDLTPIKARELIDRAIVLGQQSSNTQQDESALRMGMGKEISDAQ
ncbi:flagellar biosynthesis protein FlhF [Thiomicrorhabdus sp. ZW0627]|uniref:flagellar biosynthesis protein FlhF n=1 Tax=Thiomicrorhabdus sp. ZW0627 TaxID=3039774 RepID=UPI0024364238|nr:flagellar biosynthesis protein FlhF [Thiomicrorhabdus sp. ZW0627]MDG6773328.1 flagellar biosynthesis protein FlhF [Thiomicrorhabdus sp. ZW0627]